MNPPALIPEVPQRVALQRFLITHNLRQHVLAKATNMRDCYLSLILHGKRPLTEYHRLRLERGFAKLNLPAPW